MNIPPHNYPDENLPKALSHAEFYVLLALSRGPLSRYALKAVVRNDSLGSVVPQDGYIYPLIRKMHDESLNELAEASSSGGLEYQLSDYGLEALANEATRLRHALAILQRI